MAGHFTSAFSSVFLWIFTISSIFLGTRFFEPTIPAISSSVQPGHPLHKSRNITQIQRSTWNHRCEYINVPLSYRLRLGFEFPRLPVFTHTFGGGRRTTSRLLTGLSIFLEIQTPGSSRWRRHLWPSTVSALSSPLQGTQSLNIKFTDLSPDANILFASE